MTTNFDGASTIIYDARTATSGLLPFPMPLVLLIVAAGVIVVIVGRRKQIGDPGQLATAVVMLIFILGALVAALLPPILGMWAKDQINHHRYTRIEGCVRGFQRIVHPNDHNITDTYFSLASRDFHFNSSPWHPGFHDEDDVIRPGDGLRITMSGSRVLMIERAQTGCRMVEGRSS